MRVGSIEVGPQRIHMAAYCPDSELGRRTCDDAPARAAGVPSNAAGPASTWHYLVTVS